MTYDYVGNLETVDGPLSGTADTTRFRYNADRERIGTVSPDPDGSGSLKHRAQRVTIDGHGLVTKVETGNVNSQSDSDWSAFSAAQAVETGYDSAWRPVTQTLKSGSTAYALTQTSYDAAGRLVCTAQRMNPLGSLPSDACTAMSGQLDRIAVTTFDSADRPTQRTLAYGASEQSTDQTGYTNNGKADYVIDAELNKTTYIYDGHDRLKQTQYPTAAKTVPPASPVSNSSDHSDTVYESVGSGTQNSPLAASFRNRANQTISYTYDALGRRTYKDLPGTEPDVTYTYDLLGRMTGASQSGYALSFSYDALGRNLTQVNPQGTLTSAWDVAGRRTRLTRPGGYYVDYDYLLTGEMSAIRENGATSGLGVIATFGYDDLGRRTSLTRGNGVTTSYGYDAVSRLTSLTHDLAGSTYDISFAYSYNAAGQIVSRAMSNDLYAWGGHGSGSLSYSSNGLNQISSLGSATPTYDAKGNLTSEGGRTFSYSSENLMTSVATSSATQANTYDPLMRRVSFSTNGGTAQNLTYDGFNLVAEATGSKQYVFGPGTDEPLYDNAPSASFWLLADEKGSIIAMTNASGTVASTNHMSAFDEYGRTVNPSHRFGYAGQPYLSIAGVNDSKARMYDPRLGRFLQTDPIGYGDGMNWYNYVGGDPVNRSDPTGLKRPYVPPKTGTLLPGVTPNGYSCSGNCGDTSQAGYTLVCVEHCGREPDSTNDLIIVVHPKYEWVSNGVSFYARDGAYVYNPYHETPAWSHAFDVAVGLLFEGPVLLIGGVELLGEEGALSAVLKTCGCLEAGTLVQTPRGLRSIEEIKVGDLVLSVDEKSGKVAPKRVTDLIRPQPKPLYELRTVSETGRGATFHATDDHPWKVEGRGWVATLGLKAGDRIDTGSGKDLVVTSLTDTGRIEKTYNLTVADWHTFMVGREGAVVHNVDCAKVAKRLLQNRNFRNWFHKVYKADQGFGGGSNARNPDLGPEEILDAWDEWTSSGMPEP